MWGARQLVTLDNRPIRSRGRHLWRGEFDGEKVIAMGNTPYDDLTQRRTFLLADTQYSLLLDELSGAASGKLRQHFQLLPGEAAIDLAGPTAHTMNEAGANLLVRALPAPQLSMTWKEGWLSTLYMQKKPRPAFAFVQPQAAGQKAFFLTLLAPLPENRRVWHVTFGFEQNGQPARIPPDTIRLRTNHREDYPLTWSHAEKRAVLRKNFAPLQEQDRHSAMYEQEWPELKKNR